jgi:amidohydrolase
MDALPVTEENEVDYKSERDGFMHACGHDVHTAIALNTLCEILNIKDQISCCVKFIFQAAEEFAPSGAMLMVDDGVMDGVDRIVSLHCDPDIPVGKIGIVPGYMNATSDGFVLDFYGKSAHAAFQQHGIDAIMMAIRAYTDIEFVVAKEVSARECIVFNVGSIHGGEANNIICDKCTMYCTLRTHNDDTAEVLLQKIKNICAAVANTAGGSFEYTHKKHYPSVFNDIETSEELRQAAIAVVGENNITTKERSMDGEDFSYFLKKKPGAMFRLGIRNEARGIVNGLHTSKFDVDEDAIDIATKVYIKYILNTMK